jgi:MHS family proline/betaine transporter-like MFS transporter
MSLAGGKIGDRIGRRRTALIGLAELVVVSWPAFSLMLSGNFLLMALGSALLGVGQGLFTGAFCAMMVTLLPRRVRVTGMAFSYSLATGATGGLAPLLAEYLVDRGGLIMAPALIVMVSAALSLAVIVLHPMWRHNDESLPEDHEAAGGPARSALTIEGEGFAPGRA